MQDQSDQQPSDGDDNLSSQLFTKDAAGNYVPVIVEPATSVEDPSGKSDEGETAMYLAMQRRQHVGPLPSPETFRGYGDVLATAPERIMRMAELEQSASHEAVRTHQRDERYLVSQGQWMGFIAMMVALIGGIYLALSGHVVFACALVSPAVLTPIMRFYFKGRQDAAAAAERDDADDVDDNDDNDDSEPAAEPERRIPNG